jgi:hypothetical protein
MAVPADITKQLAEHAQVIRKLARRAVRDIIEIGQRLCEAKELASHGLWINWLEHELGMSPRIAERFMRVGELSGKFDQLPNLDFPFSTLALLAAPSTPPEIVTSVINQAKAGKKPTTAEVKMKIRQSAIINVPPVPPDFRRPPSPHVHRHWLHPRA